MSGPVAVPSSARRIGEIDTLRGFALFGILVTNVVVMTTLLSFTGPNSDPHGLYDGTWDRLVYGIVNGFFLGKFYLLFAFLFGYSFTLQIAAAERVGAAPVRRLLRRSGALFLIGLAHVALLWIGDILTLYALLCLILVLLRKIRPRPALITGVVLYLLLALLAFIPGSGDIEGLGNIFNLEQFRQGYTGTFAETFDTQIHVGPAFMLFTWIAQGVPSLGMFLIGMAAGKRRVFEDTELLRRWTPRALWLAGVVGLPISIGTVVWELKGGSHPSFWYGLQELVNPLMTLGYVAAIVWLTQSRWSGRVAHLAPAGRMAASNYIFQSIVMMLVYTGYGLALGDRVPPAGVVGIALVTYAAQLWLSTRWLRGHPYGPVEWLLRAATYRQWPAWNRTPVPERVDAR